MEVFASEAEAGETLEVVARVKRRRSYRGLKIRGTEEGSLSEEPSEMPEAGSHLVQLNNRKLQIARAQLGTALSLFLQDKDPFSVQALACGGAELIEGLAQSSGSPTLSTHIIKTLPDMDYNKIGRRRSLYWNAIKHFYQMDKKTPRDDEYLLSNFSDADNDSALFAGWYDYLALTKRLPLEAQVFQVWWYALNEDKMNPNVDRTPFRMTFTGINGDNRREQKRRLRRKIEAYRHNKALLADPRTENGPLIIRVQAKLGGSRTSPTRERTSEKAQYGS